MKFTKVNDEVLYSTENIVKVDALDINELKQKARLNHRKRIRLCAHKSVDENIHEMFIIHEKSCYVRPHKHVNKVESFHIIEGTVDIILFDEDGRINGIIPMGNYTSGRKFFYRLPPSHYHTLMIQSDVLVFHEITNGPFNPNDTVWANWAPEETVEDKVSEYKAFLENSIVENKWA